MISFAFLAQDARCGVIGSSYSVGGAVFDGAGGNGFFVGPGATTLTFDGTSKAIGSLAFGAAGDQLFIEESQTLAGDGVTHTVQVFMVARDTGGSLTTWADDGTTVGTPPVALGQSFFDMGLGNGGSDALEVNIGANDYTWLSSETFLRATDGVTFTFGSGPTDGAGPSGQFAAGIGFSAGDISAPVAAIGGREIAGYGFSWTYTLVPAAVPEPSSFALLGLCAIGAVFRRKRNTATFGA